MTTHSPIFKQRRYFMGYLLDAAIHISIYHSYYIVQIFIFKEMRSIKSSSPNNNILFVVLVLAVIGQGLSSQKIIQDIGPPRLNMNKIPINQYVSEKKKLMSFGFPDINFQISSQLYLTTSTLSQQQTFDKRSYNIDYSQFCQLYPTNLQTRTRNSLPYPDGVDVLKYTMSHNDKKSRLYILGSDSILYKYIFDQIQIKLSEQYPIDISISKIRNQELSQNIQLLEIGGRLLIITKQSFYIFDSTNIVNSFRVVAGYTSVGTVVDVGVIKNNGNEYEIDGVQIWVFGNKGIYGYQFINQNGLVSMKKLFQFVDNVAPDAIYYDQKLQQFYVIQAQTLSIIPTGTGSSKKYDIDGTCKSISKIKQALYLACQYERINFVTELKVQNQTVTLNRYYDDNLLEGIRDVQPLGYDRIALIGDEEAAIIGQATNRNVLLDLSAKDIQANYDLVYSFGMIDFYYLPQYSSVEQSCALVISQSGLSLLNIQFVPPEVECVFDREQLGPMVNILAVFNTTHCPYSVNDPNTVGGTLVICQTYYPVQIALGKRQYEQKTAKFAFFVIMLLIVVMILVCAGWGVQIRNKTNALIASMKSKIDKIKREREGSEIKKI